MPGCRGLCRAAMRPLLTLPKSNRGNPHTVHTTLDRHKEDIHALPLLPLTSLSACLHRRSPIDFGKNMSPRRTCLPEDARTASPPSGWQGQSCLASLTELRRRFRPAGHGDSITGFAVRWRPPVFPRTPDPLRLLTRREPGHPPRDSSSALLRATSELLEGLVQSDRQRSTEVDMLASELDDRD